MLILAVVQAVVAGPVVDKPLSPPPACGSILPDGTIVVCGAGPEGFRLRPLPERYSSDPAAIPKAEVGIDGVGRVALEAEQGHDAQGAPINRAMVRLKMPF